MHAHSCLVLRATVAATLLGALVALPACADGAPPSTVDAASMPRQAMKPAAPRKSNGSGIEVQFRIDGAARIGEALPIALSFDGVTDTTGARVRFTVDAGLSLPAAYAGEFTLPAGASSQTLTVPVTPTSEGLAYLNVFTTQHGLTSVSAIAVQVGKTGALKPQGDLKSTPSGDKILSIPVR
ncbi:hypothetical protein ACSFA0_22380 [Variovorax sp. LT1P1]|uniref:hypothetical protein n=1 Tax=Variovorax sp. LT1P1 TaxID=3443730 RepID=UPI003F484C66